MTEEEITELGDNLCKYCIATEYGECRVNTCHFNLCEGAWCEDAIKNYKDSLEERSD